MTEDRALWARLVVLVIIPLSVLITVVAHTHDTSVEISSGAFGGNSQLQYNNGLIHLKPKEYSAPCQYRAVGMQVWGYDSEEAMREYKASQCYDEI